MTEEQIKNRPWLFQPGQSGNPGGRPKGSKSLKTFVKEYLQGLSDEEKIEFIKGLPKEIIWKMGEGNPETKTDVTSGNKPIAILSNVFSNNSNPQDSETEEKN